MAARNFTQKLFTLQAYPVLLDCNFIVDSTNGNGLGIRSLKGNGIANVFMNTSQTPATGNPNPEAGTAIIFLQDNYNKYLGGFSGFVSALTGTSISSGMTAGRAYVIVLVGTTTLAQWQTAGLPVGITPAVGVSFISKVTSFSGTGRVQGVLPSQATSVEIVGDPNLTIKNTSYPSVGQGPYLIVKFRTPSILSFSAATHTNTTVDGIAADTVSVLRVGMLIEGTGIPVGTTIATIASSTSITISQAATASATITAVSGPVSLPVAPQNGSTCGMSFYLSNSSLPVKGE